MQIYNSPNGEVTGKLCVCVCVCVCVLLGVCVCEMRARTQDIYCISPRTPYIAGVNEPKRGSGRVKRIRVGKNE
jgi:hypothetical protein